MNTQIIKSVRNAIKAISVGMVKIANGSASANFSYQPKESANLSTLLRKIEDDSNV